MNFLEIEEGERTINHEMNEPHSHDYYELYFLLEGEREFFIDNKMFVVPKNSLVAVPPYSMHKTAGGPYRRINLNVSQDLLSDSENAFLKKISRHPAIELNKTCAATIIQLLKEGAILQTKSLPDKRETILSIAKTIIYLLSSQSVKPVSLASMTFNSGNVSSDTLKIIYYINKNYDKDITLKEICNEFYLSKVTLCKQFKKVMNCSVMRYVFNLRINKAKELLIYSDDSIEEISRICGFSSANYFGLAFKKETGLSPFNYRKKPNKPAADLPEKFYYLCNKVGFIYFFYIAFPFYIVLKMFS